MPMNEKTQSKKSRTISQARRAKVRTGCRTCKTRKVKCGEERPACHKCVSTGRVCDGYGIWGGGGFRQGPCSTTAGPITCKLESQLVNTSPVSILSGTKIKEEQVYLEWFKCRTVSKLPGAFPSDFWEVFLLQASSSEPAILHAVLALSSAHKRSVLHSGLERVDVPPDPQEQFMLHHYSKAITRLRPHLSSQSRTSARVALVTCLVFITLEYFRGHYKAGQTHLWNGLKLLREVEANGRAMVVLSPNPESLDDWIIDSYARLQAQDDFFGKHARNLRFVLQDPTTSDQNRLFQNAGQARRHLERLVDDIIYLKDRYADYDDADPPNELSEKQRSLQADLAAWLKKCKLSADIPPTQRRPLDTLAYRLLGIYHAAAEIMVAVIHIPHDEAIFDAHTSSFLSIINQAIDINRLVTAAHRLHKFPDESEMSTSITDLGWIPPLFFTALKCRHHRVRMQAIKLLSYALHKEGVWDASLTVSLVREVVRVEEGVFYQGFEAIDDFYSPFEMLEQKDLLALPVLPEEYRVCDVDVLLPEADREQFKLIITRKCLDGSWQILRRQYDARFRCWVDGSEESTKDRPVIFKRRVEPSTIL
ncbi:hypothetical protein K505DRAFT_364812 [Melanomma pulvis-pyrius CBS 109.77]|uniref:Zn(2)-C6 fungal-type domain-containing protein n=1 Tax=Melanomma pulvis-pyrius CBS 109.77 TaxID=1314802 RepID=A0A6A6X2B6_9PLEO|nr:hypothetical protein K505DRAFT_364812 [Melanomma pulvis-pyrius CBS 109.77]